MFSRRAKKLVLARERLQALTPAELTEVSGGWCRRYHHHHRYHYHHHRHHHHYCYTWWY